MSDILNETIDTGYQRPRDPVEIWLARQWQRILGFAVGIRENFFGVGGNSLDAARVIDAIMVEFGVQLPLNVVTENPTVEGQATLLRGDAERLFGPLVAIQDGLLDFTIDQQPYLQGFVPIQQLFLYQYSGGLVSPAETNTGLKFVTRANVKRYLTTQSRYEGSSPVERYPVG